MEKTLILNNIGYNFEPIEITKKVKAHKLFQKFTEDYCSAMNESFKEHVRYMSRYFDENGITYSEPNLIHYVALNFGVLYTNIVIKHLQYENELSFLSPLMLGVWHSNFTYLQADMSERGHDSLLSYFANDHLDPLSYEILDFEPCNEDNEIYFRRLLITDAEKRKDDAFVDAKKIKKKQVKKNIEHFNSIILSFSYEIALLITPEIKKADKDMGGEFKEIFELALKKIEKASLLN